MSEFNVKNLRELSEQRLRNLLGEKREELRVLKFQVAQADLKQVHQLKAQKKLIAKILTLIKQKSDQPQTQQNKDEKE